MHRSMRDTEVGVVDLCGGTEILTQGAGNAAGALCMRSERLDDGLDGGEELQGSVYVARVAVPAEPPMDDVH